jgi:hypothetical protein
LLALDVSIYLRGEAVTVRLLSSSTRSGGHATLTLSVADKQAQARTETVLGIPGWKQRRVNKEITITFGEKQEQAKHQDNASAVQTARSVTLQRRRTDKERNPFQSWVVLNVGPLFQYQK